MSIADIDPAEINPRQSLTSKFIVAAIEGYRTSNWVRVPTRAILSRRIDNFKCASGVMGLDTCSSAGLKNFRNYPLWEAIQRQRQDFQTCRDMNDIYRFSVAHDKDEAIAYIKDHYGKDEDEAARLVQMAIDNDEISRQIRKEVKEEMKRQKRKQETDCCGNISSCGSARQVFGRTSRKGVDIDAGPDGCDLEFGNCDVAGCDTGGCDIGGCDIGGCN